MVLLYVPSNRIAHTTVFDKPVVENWLALDNINWKINNTKIDRNIFLLNTVFNRIGH